MKTITLSKRFPAGHPRAGEETNFGTAFLSGRKIHTIRANAKGYYKDGDILSVRQWSGKPYASKQEVLRDGVKVGVVPVTIEFQMIDGEHVVSVQIGQELLPVFSVARNDGLSIRDFSFWFNPRAKLNLTLNYSLIHFTGFRYQ